MRDLSSSTAEDAKHHLNAYVARLPVLLDRLRQSYPDPRELDLTLASLVPVNQWFLNQILNPNYDETAEIPVWWNPAHPKPDSPFTPSQLALIDQVQAYLAEVVSVAAPEASWIVHQGPKKDFLNGQPMLTRGKRGQDYSPRVVIYGVALRKALYHRDIPDSWVVDSVAEWLSQ